MKNFSGRLSGLRKARKLKQSTVAKELGITERSYRNYEIGGSYPRLDIAERIADFFDVSLDYLVGRSDDPRRH